jgi:hypothetical protein
VLLVETQQLTTILHQPDVGPNAQFFQFCDALEVKDGISAPEQGWGLNHALPAWGSYFKNIYLGESALHNLSLMDLSYDPHNLPVCGSQDANQCLGTYNLSQSQWLNNSLSRSYA